MWWPSFILRYRPEYLQYNVEWIQELITERTKAIIPVHLFGLSANMEKVSEIAAKFNLIVIEDAACGFGSTFGGQHVGVLGNAGCFGSILVSRLLQGKVGW